MDPSNCKYCGTHCPTAQGHRSHLAQSRACRKQHFEEYAAADSSDSESDNEDGASPLGHPIEDADMDQAAAESGPEALSNEHNFSLSDSDEENIDPPRVDRIAPAPEPKSNARKHPRPSVEDVEDEDDRWVQHFPTNLAAGAILEKCRTQFQKLREEQTQAKLAPWHPFESEEEWELAHWLMTSGVSRTKTDEFLKLKAVRTVRVY